MSEKKQPQAIEPSKLAKWRELAKNSFMYSALGEYTPYEFIELLDAYEATLAAHQPNAGERKVWRKVEDLSDELKSEAIGWDRTAEQTGSKDLADCALTAMDIWQRLDAILKSCQGEP